MTKPFCGGSPAGKGQPEAGPDRGEEAPQQGSGRGHRKQLMVTMAGKKVNTLVKNKNATDFFSGADALNSCDGSDRQNVKMLNCLC